MSGLPETADDPNADSESREPYKILVKHLALDSKR